MADFSLDHNVPRRVAVLLCAAGHGATTTREIGRERASDANQLLTAVSRGCILVTHDDDFVRLQCSWQQRPAMLQSTATHIGILVIPAFPIWDADRTASEIAGFLALNLPIAGNCYQWQHGCWIRQ
jgi:predicted nuclease of predicted toxin-antitoxin system